MFDLQNYIQDVNNIYEFIVIQNNTLNKDNLFIILNEYNFFENTKMFWSIIGDYYNNFLYYNTLETINKLNQQIKPTIDKLIEIFNNI